MKYCSKCGTQLSDDALFCNACGAKQAMVENVQNTEDEPAIEITAEELAQDAEPAVVEEATPAQEAENPHKDFIGKTCPFCKTKIVEDDDIIVCPACNIGHHKSCWEENGGCTTFGCSGKPEGTVVCYNCGADILKEQAFCPKCGTPKVTQPQPVQPVVATPAVCPQCGTPSVNGNSFCQSCGTKLTDAQPVAAASAPVTTPYVPPVSPTVATTYTPAPKKAKKLSGKKVGILVAVVAVIIACIVGSSVSRSKQVAIEEYLDTAEEFLDLCIDCGSDMEDVGNEVQDYWRYYINAIGTKVYYHGHTMYDIDDAVSYALADNASTVSSVKSDYAKIKSLYSELQDVPSGDQHSETIFGYVQDVYNDVVEMYDCVIDVSGNYNTFTSTFSSCDTALANSIDKLNDALD